MPVFARSKHRKNLRPRLAAAATAVIGGLLLSIVANVATTQTADAALQQPLAVSHGLTPQTKTCLANPQWSYTWNDETGVASITAVGGAAGKRLCAPLYVRAVSWSYDNPVATTTPSWPQSFSGKNDYTISTVGTHPVSAPGVTCGQDDIYATFSSAGFDALRIDSVLTAPGVPLEPSFLHTVIAGSGSAWHADSPAQCGTALEITKSAVASSTETAVGALEPDAAFDYTIAVRNSGATSATDLTVTDTIPDGLTITGDAAGGGWSCVTTGNAVSCDYDSALEGGVTAAVIRVPVTLSSAVTADSVVNSATACASNVIECVTDEVVVTIARPGLAIVKTVSGADALAPGSEFAYGITVSNPGSSPAKDVVVTDTLQPQLRLTALPTAPGWTCTGPVGAAGATVTCTKSDPLLVTEAAVIGVPVSLIDSLVVTKVITVPNTAKACASNVKVASPTAVNGCPTSTVSVRLLPELAVLAPAGLDILKTASVAATLPGGSYSYTLLVSNTDFGDTLDVVVTDTLDPRLKLSGVPGGNGWECTITHNGDNGFGATFECALQQPLVNGDPRSIVANVVVDAGADYEVSATIPNTAVACATNVLDCVQSSASVALSGSQLTTLPFTGVEAVGVGAIGMGALTLGLGLVLLGLARRPQRQLR